METGWSGSSGCRRTRRSGGTAGCPCRPTSPGLPTELDESRYQTVYARVEGSVAAPTAGLHFTPALLDSLSAAGVVVAGLDLEIGPGTFKPVEVEDPAEHEMHPEAFEIAPRLAALVERVREDGGRVWAVGTTVVRALESSARDDGTVWPRRDQPDDHPGIYLFGWWIAC